MTQPLANQPNTDRELLDAYRNGDEQAASTLFRRYYDRLMALAGQVMGPRLAGVVGREDIAQSALRTFFRRGRLGAIDAPEDGELWPLLAVITVNKARNQLQFWNRQRRDLNRAARLEGGSIDPLENGPTPSDVMALQEVMDKLMAVFSPRRRKILEMLLQGYSFQEIAKEVPTSLRTIFNTRLAAVKALQPLLNPE